MVPQARDAARGQSWPALPVPSPGAAPALRCPAVPGQPREPPGPRWARSPGSAALGPAKSGPRGAASGAERSAPLRPRAAGAAVPVEPRPLWRHSAIGAMAERSLPAGLNASTFPAKLWRLVNNPRVRSVRWDSGGQGLLIDRSLFERELLSPGSVHVDGGDGAGPAPDSFRAAHFGSFVRQLSRYGFRKVPDLVGSAVPGDCGGWLHFRNPNFLRDRPDLLLRIQRLTRANRQRLAAGLEVRGRQPSRFQRLHTERPLPAFSAGQPPRAAPSCQNLAPASPEDSELPPGPSRGRAGAQESEASPPAAKKVCASSGLFGASPVEPSRELIRRFNLRKLTIPLVRIDPEAACRALRESSQCRSSEQHTPATYSSAPSCQNLAPASPEDSELPPGLSRRCAGAQESEASPPAAKKVCASSGLFGASPVEPSRELIRRFNLRKLTIPLVRIDPEAACRALRESSQCKSSEQHTPANSAASPEDSELPPGPSRTSAGAQEREASPAPPEKVLVTSGLLGASSEEPGTYKFQLQPELIIPSVPVPESSSCTSPEQHSPAYCPSAILGTSAPSAPAGWAGYAPWTAPRWLWNTPGEEELPPLDLDLVLETLEEMLSSSPPKRSPSAQENVNVAPESSGGEPANKAAAEGALPGTESCGNSSQEPEELDIHLIYLARRAALRAKGNPKESL
ncbi:uncharacterized protein M8220_015220 [Acridotheres tristis]